MPAHKTKSSFASLCINALWDLWCCISIVGIWPRFIEPRLLAVRNLTLPLKMLPPAMPELRIAQFSDLHFYQGISPKFLKKVIRKIQAFKPHIIAFSGDFLCAAKLADPEKLKAFLCAFSAPMGCYAVLGNHDYDSFVSINDKGEYDRLGHMEVPLLRGLRRLFRLPCVPSGTTTPAALSIGMHLPLQELLAQTPFQLLHNETRQVPLRNSPSNSQTDSFVNVCGLGEHMLGRCLPKVAFAKYDPRYGGIVLCHNPDALPHLMPYPGDIVLCGHTHGGQVNLPWFWKRFTVLENMRFKRGLFNLGKKWAFVNTGIGEALPFRWFAMPEVLLLTLKADAQPAVEPAVEPATQPLGNAP